MKKVKKILALVLVLVMVLTLIPLGNITVSAISDLEIRSKLDNIRNNKYPAGATHAFQSCWYFVRSLSNDLFGHSIPPQAENHYQFKDISTYDYEQIGKTLTISSGNLTENSLKALFLSSKSGDIIQMDYTHNGSDSLHVMMVYSVSSTGVVFYHGGSPKDKDKDGVKETKGKVWFGAGKGSDPLYGTTGEELTWSNFKKYFVNSDDGISVYRSKKVETQNYYPELLPFSSVSTYYTKYDMTVNVFGRDECYNTETILNNIINSNIDKQSNIKVQFIDCDRKSKSEVQAMLKKYSNSNITFCYDTSYNANGTMWNYAQKAGFGSSITTPLIVFRKGDGSIFKITQGTLEADYLSQLANGDLSGEEIIDLSISGKENYNYSYEVLKQLNKLRQSLNLNTLTMDEELLNAAMQRAAELSIYYSNTHTRPNGENALMILTKAGGENIAIGQTSPDMVMYSWTNSSGHYKNMTNNKFSSVGIGCFEASDGTLCWVQLFSSSSSSGISKNGIVTKEHDIKAQRRNLSLNFSPEKDIHTLSKGKYVKINVWNLNKGFPYVKQVVNALDFNFSSSNSKVISIANNGNCTIKGNGVTEVAVTHKSDSAIKLVANYRVGHIYSNNCDTTCNYCGITRTPKHNYAAATCTKPKTCKVCGATSGKALGHKWNSGKVTKKATCKATGVKTYTCSVCKGTKTETIAKSKNHTYSNSCDTKCNVCSAKRSITHTYKNIITKATLTKNGKISYKCSVCGYTSSKTTAIKKIKSVKLSSTSYTYNGKVKTPSVVVKDSAGKTLKKNTDYTVKYSSGRKNVGKYTATITFKGKYSGTKKLTFTINPPKTTAKLTAGKKSLTVKVTKKTTQVSGYQIQYSTSKNFKSSKTVTLSKSTKTSTTIKKLTSKKTYYVRVRTYKTVGKTKYYSGWSTVVSKKTK